MFAARGTDLTAVEPDAAMAAVLNRRLGGHSNVSVVVSPFEEFRPDRAFGLLFSAQAWHWTDPEVRWRKAAEALAPESGCSPRTYAPACSSRCATFSATR